MRRLWFLIPVAILAAFVATCLWLSKRDDPEVKLSDWRPKLENPSGDGEKKLRFAVASMLGPEETFKTYHDLVHMIGRELDIKGTMIIRPSYAEVRRLLEGSKVDVAFVCTGTYIASLAEKRIELLAAPEFDEGWEYRSSVIVRSDSSIHKPDQLRGRHMAFTDPESNTGCVVPMRLLVPSDETADTYFRRITFTKSHDRAIHAVERGLTDAAAVDHLILKAKLEQDDGLQERLRIVWQSEPFGVPPVVVPHTLDPELKKRLRATFITLSDSPEGEALLDKLHIRRFVKPLPERYESAARVWNLRSRPPRDTQP